MNGAKFIKELQNKGWQRIGDTVYPPNQAQGKKRKPREKINRSADEFDTRNLRNKEKQKDGFIRLCNQELGISVWPEYFFTERRNYRFDYAFPDYKLAVEVDGGIWARGKSGHSSGTGIKRDQQKSTEAAKLGWRIIRVEPKELLTEKTLNIIKEALKVA